MNLTRTIALAGWLAITLGVHGATGAPKAMHVKVTGRDFASQLSLQPKPLPQGQDLVRLDHEVWAGRQEASDARVSGRYRAAFDTWEYRDERVHFADMTFSLSNAKGSWRGGSVGVNTKDGSHFIRAIAYGQGAYRGLRYVVVVHDKASGAATAHLFDIDGWIERGTPPTTQPVVTGDVHVKVTGSNALYNVLPSMGLRGGRERTSDPRTTGKYGGTMELWTYPDGRMHFSGTYQLKNELGAWKGVWHGVVTTDRTYVQFVDALGTGEYAGLRYRHVDKGSYPKSAPRRINLSVNGWIESIATP